MKFRRFVGLQLHKLAIKVAPDLGVIYRIKITGGEVVAGSNSYANLSWFRSTSYRGEEWLPDPKFLNGKTK